MNILPLKFAVFTCMPQLHLVRRLSLLLILHKEKSISQYLLMYMYYDIFYNVLFKIAGSYNGHFANSCHMSVSDW